MLPNREGYGEEFDAFITESEGSYVREGTGGARGETVVGGTGSADTGAEGVGIVEEPTTAL